MFSILNLIVSFRIEAFSKVRNTKLSFPRKWESTLFYTFWIPVFSGMTHNSRLLRQPLRYLISILSNRFLPAVEMTLFIFLWLSFTTISLSQDKNKIDFESCTYKGLPLNGKIKFVESFPDITIQIVESFPDIKVKIVNSFPDDCGEWQIVDSFPDVKVKIVESFPDIKIKFVESFPGEP